MDGWEGGRQGHGVKVGGPWTCTGLPHTPARQAIPPTSPAHPGVLPRATPINPRAVTPVSCLACLTAICKTYKCNSPLFIISSAPQRPSAPDKAQGSSKVKRGLLQKCTSVSTVGLTRAMWGGKTLSVHPPASNRAQHVSSSPQASCRLSLHPLSFDSRLAPVTVTHPPDQMQMELLIERRGTGLGPEHLQEFLLGLQPPLFCSDS